MIVTQKDCSKYQIVLAKQNLSTVNTSAALWTNANSLICCGYLLESDCITCSQILTNIHNIFGVNKKKK